MTMKRLLLRNGFYFEDVFDCHYRLYIIMHLHVGYTLVSAESCFGSVWSRLGVSSDRGWVGSHSESVCSGWCAIHSMAHLSESVWFRVWIGLARDGGGSRLAPFEVGFGSCYNLSSIHCDWVGESMVSVLVNMRS